MAPALDADLGNSVMSGTLTTSAAAADDTRIVVQLYWLDNAVTLNNLNGGGLSWKIDHQYELSTGDWHLAFCSAYAPGGMPSGTVLTPVWSSAAPSQRAIHASSWTGMHPGDSGTGHVDTTAAGIANTTAAWATNNLVTSTADCLLMGLSYGANDPATNTPTDPATELFDMNITTDNNYTGEYRIVSSTGTYSIAGTWSAAFAQGNIGIAYKGGSPSAARTSVILVKPEQGAGWTLTPGSSAWSAGSYAELASATEFPDNAIEIMGATWAYADFGLSGADTTREWLLELATGAAASETVQVQIPWTIRWDTAAEHPLRVHQTFWLPEPLLVSAGTRIAVRARQGNTATAAMNGFKIYYMAIPAAAAQSLIWQPARPSLYAR